MNAELIQINRDSYDLNIIKKIEEHYNLWKESNNITSIKEAAALFKQLHGSMKDIIISKYEDINQYL